jgi:hypothetical protein
VAGGPGAAPAQPQPAAPSGAGAQQKPDTLNGFELAKLAVPRERVVAGGPPRDGIRAVDAPEFVPAEQATWVRGADTVIGLALGGEARAYPTHLLEWHQIVNDVVGGAPVVVSYDPLTGVPRAQRRKLGEKLLRFGVSGLLYNASFLLFDRESESLWLQWDGRAIAGALSGSRLEALRVRHEILDVWLARHPGSKVLVRPEPKRFDYRYSPFKAYWLRDEIPFPVAAEDRRYHAKELVVGVVVAGKARAYLGSILTKAGGRAEDELQGKRIQVVYDTNLGAFSWEAPEDVEVTEAYWFAWKAFHPDTEVWKPSEPARD